MNHYFGWSASILGVSVALVQVQPVQALSKAEISKTAATFTVQVQNAQNPQIAGSGVIIKKEGQNYTILTAQHVVEANASFKVMTPDQKQYSVTQGSIQKFPGVDLALIQFQSSETYSVAKIGDSAKSLLGSPSYVVGFPGTTEVRSEPTFYFTSGEIAANANRPLKDGYAIAYNNPTLPGMSGGPVLNEQGELIGIHGRGEQTAVPQNAKLREDIYVLKTEFNYAVPINTFLRMAPQVNNTLAFQAPSTPATSIPTGDDFFLQADEKLSKLDYQGALNDFNQVLRLNPNYELAFAGRGIVKGNLGDTKGAIDDLSQAIRMNPNNVRAYGARGSFKLRAGDKKGAELDLKQSMTLNVDDKDYRAYFNRGKLRKALEDTKGAIIDFNKTLTINPNFALAYIDRGAARYALGDKKGAISDYDKAIQLNPNNANAYIGRAGAQSGLGDYKSAIIDYGKAIELNPKDAYNYFSRGFSRSLLGDKAGEIADYDKAIQLDPKFDRAYYARGNARSRLGDYKGAIADFNKLLQLDPKNPLAYEYRGNTRAASGDKKGAIVDLRKAASFYKEKGIEFGYEDVMKKLRELGAR